MFEKVAEKQKSVWNIELLRFSSYVDDGTVIETFEKAASLEGW